jgi:general secretion pathway protein C
LSQPAGPGRYYINREQLGRQMSDLNQLLSTVVIQPNFVAGQAKGLRVAAVKAGSPAGALGIQSGDVLLSVNDVALGSPEDMINMYQQLQQMETITVGLERRGAPLTLTYVFR